MAFIFPYKFFGNLVRLYRGSPYRTLSVYKLRLYMLCDTFFNCFERFESFSKGTNCKAWLLRILRNKWIDLLRHRGIVGQVLQIDESVISGREQRDGIKYSNCDDLLENFSDEQIIKALKSLPPQQRFPLFLVDVERLSHEEAAEIMDVPVGTIKSRTSRARTILKQKLFSHAKEMGLAGGEK